MKKPIRPIKPKKYADPPSETEEITAVPYYGDNAIEGIKILSVAFFNEEQAEEENKRLAKEFAKLDKTEESAQQSLEEIYQEILDNSQQKN